MLGLGQKVSKKVHCVLPTYEGELTVPFICIIKSVRFFPLIHAVKNILLQKFRKTVEKKQI